MVIFDLKTTCWHPSEKDNISEIIEIGAIKYDLEKGTIISDIRFFVKPMINQKISGYCKNRTKIKQYDIDNGLSFIFAMEKFNRWIGEDRIIVSWGSYYKNQIKRESFLKAYDGDLLGKIDKNYKNLKFDFMKIFGIKKDISLNKALALCEIKSNDTDDSQNVLKIYEIIKEKI